MTCTGHRLSQGKVPKSRKVWIVSTPAMTRLPSDRKSSRAAAPRASLKGGAMDESTETWRGERKGERVGAGGEARRPNGGTYINDGEGERSRQT